MITVVQECRDRNIGWLQTEYWRQTEAASLKAVVIVTQIHGLTPPNFVRHS